MRLFDVGRIRNTCYSNQVQKTLTVLGAMMARPPFELINRYAHKRKGINVGNPALIWHRAYRKPKSNNNSDGDNDSDWHEAIDEYIIRTNEKISSLASELNVEPTCYNDRSLLTQDNRSSKAKSSYPIELYGSHISFRLSDIKISVIFEKFDEFWTVKTVLDFSLASGTASGISYLDRLHSALSEIEQTAVARFNERQGREKLNDIEKEAERVSARKRIGTLSHSISRDLHKLQGAFFVRDNLIGGKVCCDAEEDLFANFFGFSLGIGLDDAERNVSASLLPRERATDVVSNISATRVFNKDDEPVLRLIDAIWPIATELNPYVTYGLDLPPEDFEFPRVTREFTISRLNRSRALYITSLGALREIEDKGIYFPLAYLMVSPHRATWQIGRIIDRLHTLGIFRLASFVDYKEIENANNEMRRIIDRVNKDSNINVDKISDEFLALGSDIEDGLHYRIEWSRFYARIFRESIEMLTFDRVEGYQTYTEFVARKLNERFETIESVGRRFDYLSRLIQTRFGQRTGSSIKELLHFAEKVSVVPIPYYLHGVLKDFDELGVLDAINAHVVALTGAIIPFASWQVIWLISSAGYVANVMIRKGNSRLAQWIMKPFKS